MCLSFIIQPSVIPTRRSYCTTAKTLSWKNSRSWFTFISGSSDLVTVTAASNDNTTTSPATSSPENGVKRETGKNQRPKKQNQAKRERPRIPVLQYHDDWVCVR